ncbi:MAG: hypothetical protein Tsb0034_08800 [Ekhidna sp.]
MRTEPFVSVIIPVYNSGKYLTSAIESILNQTYQEFELILINDGSTDNSLSVIRAFSDNRILVLENDENKGLAYSLNKGIKESKGSLIARMDGDDIAHKDRLKKQVNFLKQNPEIGLLGTWMQSFGASKYLKKYPIDPIDCKIELLFEVPVGHPSVMFRKSLVEQYELYYNEDYKTYGEDYDLWIRFAEHTQISNVGIPLLKYRTEYTSQKRGDQEKRKFRANALREKMLRSLDFPINDKEIMVHQLLSTPLTKKDGVDFHEVKNWVSKLINWNNGSGNFAKERFKQVINEKLVTWCYHNPTKQTFRFLLAYRPFSLLLLIKFIIKFLVK